MDLESKRQHVRVNAGLGELRGVGRGLGLGQDGLKRLQRVLNRDDRGVVDGVRHCDGVGK